MEIRPTAIPGVFELCPRIFKDRRGFLFEVFSERQLEAGGISLHVTQENHVRSVHGVIRGLHCQQEPHAQSKLIRVIRGTILDVVVDVRPDSPAYGKHIAVKMSARSRSMILIPKGCLHGFAVLSRAAEVAYLLDRPFCPEAALRYRYDSPDLDIDWGLRPEEIILSPEDARAPLWSRDTARAR